MGDRMHVADGDELGVLRVVFHEVLCFFQTHQLHVTDLQEKQASGVKGTEED